MAKTETTHAEANKRKLIKETEHKVRVLREAWGLAVSSGDEAEEARIAARIIDLNAQWCRMTFRPFTAIVPWEAR